MTALREEARRELHVYMSRSGLTLPELAQRIGYSPCSLRQFSSNAHYGDGDGHLIQFCRGNSTKRAPQKKWTPCWNTFEVAAGAFSTALRERKKVFCSNTVPQKVRGT